MSIQSEKSEERKRPDIETNKQQSHSTIAVIQEKDESPTARTTDAKPRPNGEGGSLSHGGGGGGGGGGGTRLLGGLHWKTDQDRRLTVVAPRSHGSYSSRTTSKKRRRRRTVFYENTYKLGPDVKLNSCEVTKLMKDILDTTLEEVVYETNRCKELSQSLVTRILSTVKDLSGISRYKFVATVSVGSLAERPALQVSSRCLWDTSVDTFSTITFTNETLYATATVYALYHE